MEQAKLHEDKSIDRKSPLPYYSQLKALLIEEIESERWEPEQQLPSEADLCEHFGVSRTVVRQALSSLVQQGFIYREKGKGTYVARPKIAEGLFQNLTGFYEDMLERGLKPVTKVLEQTKCGASRKVARQLGLSEKDPVIEIKRLRFINNKPLVLVTTYLPYDICPFLLGEDLSNKSLYCLLEDKYDIKIVYGHRTLEAVSADEYVADLLAVKVGAPLMLLNSVGYLGDGRPIEYYHALHRGDLSKFAVTLIRICNRPAKLADDDIFPYLLSKPEVPHQRRGC